MGWERKYFRTDRASPENETGFKGTDIREPGFLLVQAPIGFTSPGHPFVYYEAIKYIIGRGQACLAPIGVRRAVPLHQGCDV